MRRIAQGFTLLTLALIGGSGLVNASPIESSLRWKYRALTKEQVLGLGNKDLTAGLNQLVRRAGNRSPLMVW